MKRGKQSPVDRPGRCYTTNCDFPLTARERWRALLGGHVHVQVRLFVSPGASDIPSQIAKRVEPRAWRWPWGKAA